MTSPRDKKPDESKTAALEVDALQRLNHMVVYLDDKYQLSHDFIMPNLIAYGLINGATVPSIQTKLPPHTEYWVEQAQEALAKARFKRLEHYFALKNNSREMQFTRETLSTFMPQSLTSLILGYHAFEYQEKQRDLLLPFLQAFGTLFQIKIALGAEIHGSISGLKDDIYKLAVGYRKSFAASERTKGNNLLILQNDLFIAQQLDQARSIPDSFKKSREHYETLLKDLAVLYRKVFLQYDQEVQRCRHVGTKLAETKAAAGAVTPAEKESVDQATDKFKKSLKTIEGRMLTTMKGLRKTYAPDAKDPISENILKLLPIGTALKWQFKLFKKIPEAPQLTIPEVNLLDVSQIEEVPYVKEDDQYGLTPFGHS